ncbi:MAG: DNA mismatch repair endonuclease MutL [Bacilli bacterium]
MSKIKIMDEILANKIAAGEVVERCASVVKELVENSIDAQSSDIKIELIEAGTTSIKVTDDGLGMDKEDAILAFNRHATSKITDEDDLYRINTLGFRGEALASIASVSNITLKTSTGLLGTIVVIKGGKVISVTNGDARKGTSIEVKELFYNTPARLKHMKSLYAELASITEYISKLALSHVDIRFTLINNGNVLIKTDGSGLLLKAINNIYGIEVTKKMLEVQALDGDYEINGYISLPQMHRSSRNHIITLVNGRVVRNIDLNRVINDSYHSYKPDNRYPIVVLNILVDPSLIDVNIHPTKMDIKFSKMEELLDLVKNMIIIKLKKQVLIPEVDIITPIYENNVIINDVYIKETVNKITDEKPAYENSVYEEQVLELDRVSEPIEVYDTNKRLPELYPIGVVHGTYIVCQNELGMYLIDQHAAKERVNYELFKENLGHPLKKSINLIIPLTIELTSSENIIIKENFPLLIDMGFEIEEFGLNSIVIKAHPTWLPSGYENDAIRKILDVVLEKEKDFDITKFNEKIATSLACKLAIKANMKISINEMECLINSLRKCANPFNCPHGRPTIIYYSNYDLEKLFKRSGFENLK